MIRLSAMMALLYAIQGAWWPLLAIHLRERGFSGWERGWIYGSLPIALIIASLGVGRLVDRFVAIQRYLAGGCLAGGMVLVLLAAADESGSGFPVWLMLMLTYWLVMAPLYGLSNTMAMRNLDRPAERFGQVRLWGTVGWMGVGWLVTLIMSRTGQGVSIAFGMAAMTALGTAALCLSLPHTPPLDRQPPSPSETAGDPQASVVLDLMRDRSTWVYLVCGFGVSLTTPFMFQAVPPYLERSGLPQEWVPTALTLGQLPEIAALAATPWLLSRLGFRITMALGILAWIVRYGSLALGVPLWAAILGNLLHGVAVANFSIVGQMYMDHQAPGTRRASAQALNVVITSGLGALCGSLLAGVTTDFLGERSRMIFWVPTTIDAIMLVVLLRLFREPGSKPGPLLRWGRFPAKPSASANSSCREETNPVSQRHSPTSARRVRRTRRTPRITGVTARHSPRSQPDAN